MPEGRRLPPSPGAQALSPHLRAFPCRESCFESRGRTDAARKLLRSYSHEPSVASICFRGVPEVAHGNTKYSIRTENDYLDHLSGPLHRRPPLALRNRKSRKWHWRLGLDHWIRSSAGRCSGSRAVAKFLRPTGSAVFRNPFPLRNQWKRTSVQVRSLVGELLHGRSSRKEIK